LRYGYLLLAYAERPDSESAFPIAVVSVALSSEASSAVFVRADWESRVAERDRDYIRSSFEDWLKLIDSNGGVIPASLLELSVGPFRSVRNGECDEQELIKQVAAFLPDAYQRFGSW
jgi:hypothetical protein